MFNNRLPAFGFLINSLEPSELVFRIMMGTNNLKTYDVTIFWEKLGKAPIPHLNSNMHITEAYNFEGPLIATNIKTAYKLIRYPTPRPKFFYIEDPEWIHFPSKRFAPLSEIYGNKELIILARCQEHANIIENAWNVKVDKIIHNYDFFGKDFIDYLETKKLQYPFNEIMDIPHKNILSYL